MSFSFLRPELSHLKAYTTDANPHALPPECIDHLDTNEFPLDLPPPLKQKFVDHLCHAIAANRYPDGSHAALKLALADYVNENTQKTNTHQAITHTITPNQITVGCGSDELIRSILLATCTPGQDAILMAEPTFSMYEILAQGLGIGVKKIRRDAETFAMDLVSASQRLSEGNIKVIFIVHPNSPTGNALTDRELAWLKTISPQVFVVIDEAYFEFSGQTLVAELAHHPHWLILRTFSKAFRLAAFRIGYGIGHPEVILALEKLRLPYNVTAPSLAAAQLVLAERAALLADIPGLLEQRQQILQALQNIPGLRVWPSAANFLYFQAQDATTTEDLAHTLRQAGSLVRFTCDGIRLTIGTTDENERVLTRIQAWGKSQ